jgi:predicted sulfurtransferase
VSPIDSTGQSIDTPTVPESSSDIPDSIYETPFISNTDFQNVIKNQETESYIILDARENLEYAIGHIPGSLHMRDADIQSGEWKTLSPGKKVYVVCWSGMR